MDLIVKFYKNMFLNKNYILNKLKGYNFEENKVLKIVTHSDDNYIELAQEVLKSFGTRI